MKVVAKIYRHMGVCERPLEVWLVVEDSFETSVALVHPDSVKVSELLGKAWAACYADGLLAVSFLADKVVIDQEAAPFVELDGAEAYVTVGTEEVLS